MVNGSYANKTTVLPDCRLGDSLGLLVFGGRTVHLVISNKRVRAKVVSVVDTPLDGNFETPLGGNIHANTQESILLTKKIARIRAPFSLMHSALGELPDLAENSGLMARERAEKRLAGLGVVHILAS